MIVAVMSDTHLETPDRFLEAIFRRFCLDADVLIHCGDCVGDATWAFLNAHPCLVAVQGNCDLPPLRGSLPALREVELDGLRFGLGHGWGPRSKVGVTVAAQFPDADVVCYGHTHIRDWRKVGRTWLLNPGSLFWPREGDGGMARLHLESGKEPTVEWITL